MNTLKWFFCTKRAYHKLEQANQVYREGMYFLTDTGEYYYHGINFMCNTLYFTGALPQDPVTTRVYFNTSTLTGYVFDGENWHVLIEPAKINILVEEGGAAVPQMITGEAVKEYADRTFVNVNQSNVVNLSWNPDTKQIFFERYVNTNEALPMFINTYGCILGRNDRNGDITMYAADGVTELSKINIPVDNYIQSGLYDDTKKAIVFTMTNGPDTVIYARDIVKLYNSITTATIACDIRNVDGINFIEMRARVSATEGNEIVEIVDKNVPLNNGLYNNRYHLMDFINPIDYKAITLLDQEGNSKTSAHYIGGSVRNNDIYIQAQNNITDESLRHTKEDIIQNQVDTYLTLAAVRDQYAGFARIFKMDDRTA